MSTLEDYQLAALATGFTIGFGLLTVWEAIKQTRRNRNRLRSQYIYMVWGEILANVVIVIMGWLFLHGIIGPSIPTLFFILFFWVFQIQLLMQIIVNRIALIAEHRKTVAYIKWGTAAIITSINVTVFIIWIPSHTMPAHPTFVKINEIWDKIEKVLILLVDAGLNYYFLRTVKQRLVKQHGLKKYAPLVGFNAKLMVVSVGMDALLIGLMFLKNQVVYVQFHPVVYMVKLNIEMSMASLVVRIAQSKNGTVDPEAMISSTDPGASARHGTSDSKLSYQHGSFHMSSRQKGAGSVVKSTGLSKIDSDEDLGGIQCRTDVNVVVEKIESPKGTPSIRSSNDATHSVFGDEIPLATNAPQVSERRL